jgi:hypothetical protein
MTAFDINNLRQFYDDVQHKLPLEFPQEIWAGTISPKAATMTAAIVVESDRKQKIARMLDLSRWLHGEIGPAMDKYRTYLSTLAPEKMTPEAKSAYEDARMHLNLSGTLLVSYSTFLHQVASIFKAEGE